VNRSVQRSVTRLSAGSRHGVAAPDVPVLVWQGEGPGPTLLVTGGVHGDESSGPAVVRALEDVLAQGGWRGRVRLYPSLNPHGLASNTRVVPLDEADLNRAFPGDARGRWSARTAAMVWRDIEDADPDVLIDLHADSVRSVPYVVLDRPLRLGALPRAALGERMTSFATSTGWAVVRDYEDAVYRGFGLDQSLTGAVVNRLGRPALTFELGARRVATEDAVVARGVEAVVAVMRALGLYAREEVVPSSDACAPSALRRCPPLRAGASGWLEPLVPPGATVSSGQVLGRLVDLTGSLVEVLTAPADGCLLGWVDWPWVTAGGSVATLAVQEGGSL
jgi:predicted deacylase